MNFKRALIAHGGAGSSSKHNDGADVAVKTGLQLINQNKSSFEAVVAVVKVLEDDTRFNAGTGSQIRCDGKTIQMDASCMNSDGNFGAVACIENVKNPIEVAAMVLKSSNLILSGNGAVLFAESNGFASNFKEGKYKKPLSTPSCDTVGAVAFDGKGFSAALSSGGLKDAALGRIGDVPLPGCGLFSGPIGAIACTGDGEFIALKILAKQVYTWLEEGFTPEESSLKALDLFDKSVEIGLIILTKDQFSVKSRNDMAWSYTIEVD